MRPNCSLGWERHTQPPCRGGGGGGAARLDGQPQESDGAVGPYASIRRLHPRGRAQGHVENHTDRDSDWRLVPLSQLLPRESRQLITSAGMQLWQDIGGSVILCESNGTTRTELPRPRGHNGRRAPPVHADDDDTWSRIGITTATCPELTELLMGARLCVCENATGDLQLREWNGAQRALLRAPGCARDGGRLSMQPP